MKTIVAQSPEGDRTVEFCVANCFPYVKIARQAWAIQQTARMDCQFDSKTELKFRSLADKLIDRIDAAPEYVIDVSQCTAAVRKGVVEMLTGKTLTGKPGSVSLQQAALAKASLAS